MQSSAYDLVVFLHVASVLMFFGIAGILHAAMTGITRATNIGVYATWNRLLKKLSPVMGFVALAVLALGVVLMIMNNETQAFSWSTPWVIVSIVALFVFEGLSGMLLTPYGKAINGALERVLAAGANGGTLVPADLHELTLTTKAWVASFVVTWGFVGIVLLMIVKPNLIGSLAAVIVAAVLGAVEGIWLLGRAKVKAAGL